MKCFRLRCCVNNSFLVFHQGTKHSKTIKHSRFALLFHTVFSCLDPLMKHSNSLFTYNIKHCHACQVTSHPPRPEPMCPTELPGERWSQLAIDVCGPFPTGEYIVVVTDNYSRWPEAKILKTVTSASILMWLNEVFAQHGYTHVLKSDIKSTLNSWGIQLRTVTEYWPQANGQAERFN